MNQTIKLIFTQKIHLLHHFLLNENGLFRCQKILKYKEIGGGSGFIEHFLTNI